MVLAASSRSFAVAGCTEGAQDSAALGETPRMSPDTLDSQASSEHLRRTRRTEYHQLRALKPPYTNVCTGSNPVPGTRGTKSSIDPAVWAWAKSTGDSPASTELPPRGSTSMPRARHRARKSRWEMHASGSSRRRSTWIASNVARSLPARSTSRIRLAKCSYDPTEGVR